LSVTIRSCPEPLALVAVSCRPPRRRAPAGRRPRVTRKRRHPLSAALPIDLLAASDTAVAAAGVTPPTCAEHSKRAGPCTRANHHRGVLFGDSWREPTLAAGQRLPVDPPRPGNRPCGAAAMARPRFGLGEYAVAQRRFSTIFSSASWRMRTSRGYRFRSGRDNLQALDGPEIVAKGSPRWSWAIRPGRTTCGRVERPKRLRSTDQWSVSRPRLGDGQPIAVRPSPRLTPSMRDGVALGLV